MAGDGLGFSKFGDGVRVEIAGECAQIFAFGVGEARRSGQDVVVQQVDEPFHLYVYARAVQAGFGEVVGKWCHRAAVASI